MGSTHVFNKGCRPTPMWKNRLLPTWHPRGSQVFHVGTTCLPYRPLYTDMARIYATYGKQTFFNKLSEWEEYVSHMTPRCSHVRTNCPPYRPLYTDMGFTFESDIVIMIYLFPVVKIIRQGMRNILKNKPHKCLWTENELYSAMLQGQMTDLTYIQSKIAKPFDYFPKI